MPRTAALACALLLAATSAHAASGPQIDGTPTPDIRVKLSTPAFFYTNNLGADGSNFSGEMRFYIELMNSVNAAPPITVRSTLPDGITFVNSANSGWTCTALGQELSCVSSVGLQTTARERNVRVRVNVAGDIPVPGSSTVRALREHASLPPPSPTNCASIPEGALVYSDTGCVERDVEHRQSRIWIEPTGWSHSPAVYLAGSTDNPLSTLVRSEGFHTPHLPITARLLLPPGFLFNRSTGNAWSCTAQPATAIGQWVDCPYILGAFNISQGPLLRINVAADVQTPGPLVIVAHVGNSFQPPPASIDTCLGPTPPVGCGSYAIPTGTPPRAQMVITQITQDPVVFRSNGTGRITVQYTNSGQVAAGAITLSTQLPPGLTFTGTGTSTPLANCTASGSAAVGQVVSCSMAAGFGVGQSGTVNLNVDVEWAGFREAPVTGAIGDTTRPAPTLATCIADPGQIGCGQSLLRISDDLFCDGYETPFVGCLFPD
jgi:uncharacterized repeat protein (TIGR01451 family)